MVCVGDDVPEPLRPLFSGAAEETARVHRFFVRAGELTEALGSWDDMYVVQRLRRQVWDLEEELRPRIVRAARRVNFLLRRIKKLFV